MMDQTRIQTWATWISSQVLIDQLSYLAPGLTVTSPPKNDIRLQRYIPMIFSIAIVNQLVLGVGTTPNVMGWEKMMDQTKIKTQAPWISIQVLYPQSSLAQWSNRSDRHIW